MLVAIAMAMAATRKENDVIGRRGLPKRATSMGNARVVISVALTPPKSVSDIVVTKKGGSDGVGVAELVAHLNEALA